MSNDCSAAFDQENAVVKKPGFFLTLSSCVVHNQKTKRTTPFEEKDFTKRITPRYSLFQSKEKEIGDGCK